MADQYEVECPMAGCTEPLGIVFSGLYVLAPEDVKTDTVAPGPTDVQTAGWRIECMAGHVVLLPTEAYGCPVEWETDEPCPHGPDAHDGGEDYRRLRTDDIARLNALTARLTDA